MVYFHFFSPLKSKKYFEDYILSILSFLNHHYPQHHFSIHYYPQIYPNSFIQFIQPQHVLIYLFKIPPFVLKHLSHHQKYHPVYLLNTEQLSIPKHNYYIHVLPRSIHLLDYSLSNIHIKNQHQKKSIYLPYFYNPNEYKEIEKTNEICMIHPGTQSQRRQQFLYLCKKNGIKVNIIHGFGNERDNQLFSHKILLNIHFDSSYQIFEEIRCNRCIHQKMIVISESSLYHEHNILKKHMIEVPIQQMISKIKEVQINYHQYHEELFREYDVEKIQEYYKFHTNFWLKNYEINEVEKNIK